MLPVIPKNIITYIDLNDATMKLAVDVSALPLEEQKRLYLWLKAKFEPELPIIYTATESQGEAMLDKTIKEVNFSTRVFNGLMAARINTIRDLCNCSKAELMKLGHLGKRSVAEIESVLSEMGLELTKKLSLDNMKTDGQPG